MWNARFPHQVLNFFVTIYTELNSSLRMTIDPPRCHQQLHSFLYTNYDLAKLNERSKQQIMPHINCDCAISITNVNIRFQVECQK